MVVAQLFEVTVAANGTELSSKRVSKLSRRYHLLKKQLRQSAMMAEGFLSDAAATDGGNDDDDRSGGQFDTSADAKFSLSTQPPSIGHRSTISVAMNHPAAAARRAKKPLPPRRESPGRNCKTNANAHITEMCRVGGRLPPRSRLPPRPPSLPPRPPSKEVESTPLAPHRKSAVVDDLIIVAAGEDGSQHGRARPPISLSPRPPSRSTTPLVPQKSLPVDDLLVVAAGEDGSRHGGEEAVAAATRVGEVLGEVLDISSSVDSSDDEVLSVQSSPDFDEHNDPFLDDSPTDNEVSKYSFYSRLTHYMEGHKISESNRAAVELCLLSEAGAFVRNMDPMKKDKKERFFFRSISPSSMKLRMTSLRTQTILSVIICAECIRVLRKRILLRVCGGNTKLS